MSVKTYYFFLHDFIRATKLATHLSIIFLFPSHTHPFCPLSFHPYHVFPPLSLNLDLTSHGDSVGLWNCQSAVNKADFILAFFFTIRTQHLGLDWDLDSSRDFHSLLASFDLEHLTTASTHKAGNQLDLIYTRNCTADNILVEKLHISNHFFITFKWHFATCVPPTPLPVTFRRNLRSLSPSHLSSVESSSLPSPTHFSSLDVNAATDTLFSTLTSCLDDICLLLQASTSCPF